MSTNKRKGRGSMGSRTGRTRPVFDKSVLTEGVYANARWTHAFTSLIGSVVQVQVKNSSIYEGVLRTFSPKMEIVLEMAHKCDEGQSIGPTKDRLLEKIIFSHTDVVTITTLNVDLDYANRDNFTDSGISKFNGQVTAKELQPWECDHDMDEVGGLESMTMDSSSPNGWDPQDMFRTNAEQFNVKSTYDSSLRDYTTVLEHKDSPEFKEKEAKAQKLANEIEQNEQYKARIELENNDEDEKISAVVRPDGGSASPSSSSGKYVPPQMRKNTQQNRVTRVPGSQLAQSPPVKQDISPEEEKNRKNISTNLEDVRVTKPMQQVETAAPDSTTSRDSSPAVLVETKTDNGINPSPAGSPDVKQAPESKKSPVSQKIQNDEQLAELKAFSKNFKLENEKVEKKEDDARKESMEERSEEMKEDDKTISRTSTLNPLAKEFVFNPKAPMFIPKQQQQPIPITTPPRPQTQSPVVQHPQQQAITPMHGQVFHTSHYMMPGQMVSMPQTHIPTAQPQQPPQRGAKRAVVSVHQQEFSPSTAQAVSATGAPILAQPPPIHNQAPQGYHMPYMTPMVGQHGAGTPVGPAHMSYPQQVMQLQSGNPRLMNPQNATIPSHPAQGMNNPAMQQQSATAVLVPGTMHGQVPPGHQPPQQGGPQQQPHHHPVPHYQPQHHHSRATPPQSQPSHPAPSPAHQPNAPPPPQHPPHQGHPPSSTPTQMMYTHSQHIAPYPLQQSPHTPTSPQTMQANMPYSYAHQMPNHGGQPMTLAHIPQTSVSFSTQHTHSPQTHQTPSMIMVAGPPHHPGAQAAVQHGHQQMQHHPQMQGPPVHPERHRFPSVPAGHAGAMHQAPHGAPMGHPQQTAMGMVPVSQAPPQMHHHQVHPHPHPHPYHTHPQSKYQIMHTQNHPPVQAFQPNP
ncbi:ataxin-2-like protein isoform X3 [Lineus longissimus]|uniref:ataxin-2-like protein isoform X3 n=1 Tax=Lineus longissimus TaxID=88925 RepID=UPI00315CF6C4